MLKLEAGKRYIRRDGSITATLVNGNLYEGSLWDSDLDAYYDNSKFGNCFYGDCFEGSLYDLISEYSEKPEFNFKEEYIKIVKWIANYTGHPANVIGQARSNYQELVKKGFIKE